MPVAEFPGRRGWGYDGVDLFAPHHGYGGPDGLKRLVDAAHARGLGVVIDVVYNHLGPAGNYLPEFGPYFSARHRTNWGAGGQLRRAGQRRGPPLRHRQRADVAARLPLRRAAARRRARHRRRLGDPHPRGARRRGRARSPRTAAGRCSSSPRATATTRVSSAAATAAATASTPPGPTNGITRCTPSSPARRPGTTQDFGSLRAARQGAAPGVGVRRQLLAAPPAGTRPVSGRADRQPVRGEHPEPRPGRQPRGRRADRCPGQRRAAAGGRRAAAHRAVRAAAVPGRGVGRARRRSSTSPTTPIPSSGGPSAQGAGAEFAAFGWDPADVPDPQDPATFARSRLDWAEPATRSARRPAGLVPRADRAAAAGTGADRPAARPDHRRLRRPGPAGWWSGAARSRWPRTSGSATGRSRRSRRQSCSRRPIPVQNGPPTVSRCRQIAS